MRVADDGPGVPGLEALLTRMDTGAGPGGRDAAALAFFGMGLCVTDSLSSRLTAEARREGIRWVQEYARGVALAPSGAAGPTTGSGTTVTFRPDTEIFGTVECSFAALAERFRELAFLNPRLDVSLNVPPTDERPRSGPRSERFRFPGGLRDFVVFLGPRAGPPLPPGHHRFRTGGRPDGGDGGGGLRMVRLPRGADTELRRQPTREGGTHLLGLRDGVADAVDSYARRRRLLTAADPELDADRIGEGLTAVVSVKLDRPEHSGATLGLLGGAHVRACVGRAVREHLGTWLEEHPERAADVVGRIVRAARRH